MNNKKIRLTESELKQVVEASVRKILVKEGFGDWASDKFNNAFRGYKDDIEAYEPEELYESFNMGGSDMVRFYLNSPMNGRQVITVPFNEFANAKSKLDYLWKKAVEQGNIKLKMNGYFEVDPNDPHKAEVDRIF